MGLDSSFAALYIGPDKLGAIKAQKTKNGVNILDKGYLNYGGYDKTCLAEDTSNVLSRLLEKLELPKDSLLAIGIPQEFCLHSIEQVQLRLPQAEEYGLRQEEQLLSKISESPKGYDCIEKGIVRYYQADGAQITSPYGLITKEISADIALTYATQNVLQVIESNLQKINVKAVYTGIANAIAKRFIPYSARDSDTLLVSIGYAETIIALTHNFAIVRSIHFTLGVADIICDLIKVLKIGYLHALALFEVLDLSIMPTKNDKYTITVKGDKFEYDVNSINEIAAARIKQIFDCCLEAILKLGNPEVDVYLVCRGFSQEKGLIDAASKALAKNVIFASTNAFFFKDKPEEEALLNYCSSIVPQSKTNKKRSSNRLISLFRRKKVG